MERSLGKKQRREEAWYVMSENAERAEKKVELVKNLFYQSVMSISNMALKRLFQIARGLSRLQSVQAWIYIFY